MRYAELRCKTNGSFLRGASHPQELVARAAELGLHALAITDRDGLYGMPKAYFGIQEHPELKLVVGAELTLEDRPPLTLLARDRAAYGVLCRLITAAHRDAPKGEALLKWQDLVDHLRLPGARGLFCMLEPVNLITLTERTRITDELSDLFGQGMLVPLLRLLDGRDRERTEAASALQRRYFSRIVATNDVHYHAPRRRILHDLLTATREGVPLSRAGTKLFSNSERYLKSPAQMAELFRDLPEALVNTVEVADQCTFSPSELRYRYPSEWIPAGETAQSYLERLTRDGAAARYPRGVPEKIAEQLERELALIAELKFADYFLTIWDIVDFARKRKILCQGRGSAANSAVCYALGITAIDPTRIDLLFERFISVERAEPPDIDVDFEHERREEVIQYVYAKYGRDRAAMVAAVITYREKLALREACKVLEADPENPTPNALKLAAELEGFPRHLSIHSGGFTLSADPLIETVPVEPARMEGRTIVQWDKDDLDAIGLLKVDLLSLGMLSALRKTIDMVPGSSLYGLPEDPATYEMIQKADTVGTFQIESRAQMSMLPRLKPRNFYDLVVQVAIVRPGPIQGNMVHPYLERRRQREKPDYFGIPELEQILGKTFGVPLFQEQVMRMAISLADFTPGQADQLRKAVNGWRSGREGAKKMKELGGKLMDGLRKRGIPDRFAQQIYDQIQGFAEYGFPESHSASFALLAYASAYFKCHHPAEFTCALINSQPMGFYSNHTLVDDAKRHGVEVRPVHPNLSDWDCALERAAAGARALRLGWRVVSGLAEADARAIVEERRARGPFASLPDFLSRARIRSDVLHQLAIGDAFSCFGLSARDALWEILAYELSCRPTAAGQLNLFSQSGPATGGGAPSFPSPSFPAMSELERVQADYATYGLSTRAHPMQALRASLTAASAPERALASALSTAEVRRLGKNRLARAAGLLIVRQRPPTAKGVTFATLEDEHGFLDLILHPEVAEKYRDIFLRRSFLVVEGLVQRDGEALSVLVRAIEPIRLPRDAEIEIHSHDFR